MVYKGLGLHQGWKGTHTPTHFHHLGVGGWVLTPNISNNPLGALRQVPPLPPFWHVQNGQVSKVSSPL